MSRPLRRYHGDFRFLAVGAASFNYALLGNSQNPPGYHRVNFILHLGNIFLVFILARKLLRELCPSFFMAALWAERRSALHKQAAQRRRQNVAHGVSCGILRAKISKPREGRQNLSRMPPGLPTSL